MERYGNDWMRDKEKWFFLESMRKYQCMPLVKELFESNDNRSLLPIEIHNRLGLNDIRTLNTVCYFVRLALAKLQGSNKWNLEIWLLEDKLNNKSDIICSAALTRSRAKSIYIEKSGVDFHDSIEKCIGAICQKISIEKNYWNIFKNF